MNLPLPSGTVTFLFTDIEGSTRRWEEDPAATRRALALHDAVLRRAVATAGGAVFAHTGDGIAAVFARAGASIESAVAAQQALAREAAGLSGVAVRMAVHTGEAEERDGNYFGPAVNRAARLMATAAGGHVLVSLSTAEVVRDWLPEGVTLVERGEVALRSLSRPERVFELIWAAPVPLSGSVEIGVLGPLRLVVDGVDVNVPGPKRRAVLALLVMGAPHAVSVDGLATELWPHDDIAASRAALQSHVSRLRRHLGVAGGRLERGPGGYRLRLEPGELDATRAAGLVDEARRLTGTDAAAAADLVREARSQWRGEPLEEFADIASLAAWQGVLAEQRQATTELHAELTLAAGRRQEAVEAAVAAVAGDPLRERSTLLLVRALAASGRAVDALRTAQNYRRHLADETGLEPSPALAELEHRVAAGDAAPPVAIDGPQAVLTSSRSARGAIVGREVELAGVLRLSRSEALVTLVGPGGVGKTSLALAAAASDRSDRHVAVVALAPINHDAAVVDAVATALGLRGDIGDPLDATVALLQTRSSLLVLDNCEHVIRSVRHLVTALTASCPDLTILATSRQRLGLPMEQICPVAPLAVPSVEERDDLDRVASVAMFLARAKRTRAGFDPDDEELAAIAAIVRRLDGMPLAIELAAGRLGSLSLADLTRRLDQALDILSTGTSAPDDRHGSLRTAIEWSYDLLAPEHQRVFRALSVFTDGFDLATAEDVARDVAPSADPTGAIAHLVETSMMTVTFGRTTRYRMLETLRAFGLDRLAAHSEQEEATERYLRWADRFAAWVDATITTADEPHANQRLLEEFGNLRAAWHLARSRDDVEHMVAIVLGLYYTLTLRDISEVFGWIIELAAHPRLAEHPRVAHVLAAASTATWRTGGDLERATQLAERALALADPDDTVTMAACIDAVGTVRTFEGRFTEAAELFLSVAEALGDPLFWSAAGYAFAYAGLIDQGRAANAHAADADCPTSEGHHHYAAGELDNAAGEWASAQAHYREAIRLSDIAGASFLHGIAATGLVTAQAAGGDVADALRGYAALLDLWESTGAWMQQWTTLRNLADLLERLDDADAADALRRAADAASEAAIASPSGRMRVGDGTATRSRLEVLQLARLAIARQTSVTGPGPVATGRG